MCKFTAPVWLDLNNQQSLPLLLPQSEMVNASPELPVDFSEVKGQELAKRVLEIAAAGGHNVLFTGPPGTGKSMLAQRMATIMPRMTTEQALQTAAVYSVSDTILIWRVGGSDLFVLHIIPAQQ